MNNSKEIKTILFRRVLVEIMNVNIQTVASNGMKDDRYGSGISRIKVNWDINLKSVVHSAI